MRTFVLDTNCWLRFFLRDNIQQFIEVDELLIQTELGRNQVVVPIFVIWEIIFCLMRIYQLSKVESVKIVETIAETPYLQVENRPVVLQALNLFSSSGLSFADVYILCFSQGNQSELFTFDQKLKNAASRQ